MMKNLESEDGLIKKWLAVFVGGHVLVVTCALLFIFFYFIRFAIDFYVYAQAIAYWSFSNINPAIPLRGFYIFNDHFDILLILPALVGKLINPVLATAFSDYVFILMTVAFFYYLYKKDETTLSVSAFAIVYTLLGFATLAALRYASHPTSWSIFPITLLCWFFHERRNVPTIFSYLLLLSCKEEFITVGVMLFVASLYRRDYKLGFMVALITFFWSLFVFKLRFILWPYDRISYGKDLLEWFLSNPLGNIYDFYNVPQALYAHIFVFSPILVVLWTSLKNKVSWKEIDYSPLLFVLPIYFIRVMPGTWVGRHYGFFSDHYVISISSFIIMFFVINFPKITLRFKALFVWFIFIALSNVPTPNKWPENWKQGASSETAPPIFQKAAIFNNEEPIAKQLKMYEERRKEAEKALGLARVFVKEHPNNNVFGDKVFITHLAQNPYNFRASDWITYHDPEKYFKNQDLFKHQIWTYQVWSNMDLINKNASHELVFLEKKTFPSIEEAFKKSGNVMFDGRYIFLASREIKN